MEWLYQLGVSAYTVAIHLVSPFNTKAQKWVEGRKSWRDELARRCKTLPENRVWFHSASVGEFEQAIPVIEKLKEISEVAVILTFFSPSGYEQNKEHHLADVVAYLPSDNQKNAADFIEIVKPKQVVFVKYEFWFYYLRELHKRSIPTFLASAVFREDQHFFKKYGKWFRNSLYWYAQIFVQNRHSRDLLHKFGLENVEIVGDTRLDRVWTLANNNEEFPLLDRFKQDHRILIVGSSWDTEEEWIIRFIQEKHLPNWRFIIAPHEINEAKLKHIANSIEVICYSELDKLEQQSVLLCDGYGYLSRIYKYADIAFVGGGFHQGIHSTLEPAAFGMPLVFGPHHKSFIEPTAFIELGIGFEVNTYEAFRDQVIDLASNEAQLTLLQKESRRYVERNSGASKLIVEKMSALI